MDISEFNIVSTTRKRKVPDYFSDNKFKRNRVAFLLALLLYKKCSEVLYVFSAALIRPDETKIYQNNLSSESRSYSEMLRHLYKDGFIEITLVEIAGITNKNTYRLVDCSTNISIVPVK